MQQFIYVLNSLCFNSTMQLDIQWLTFVLNGSHFLSIKRKLLNLMRNPSKFTTVIQGLFDATNAKKTRGKEEC